MRDSDEADAEIDDVLQRTQAQLSVLDQRVQHLASVISGGGSNARNQ